MDITYDPTGRARIVRNADLTHLGTCCCCGNDDAYYPVCVDCVPQADCDHGLGGSDELA